jgi:hypothetical protein
LGGKGACLTEEQVAGRARARAAERAGYGRTAASGWRLCGLLCACHAKTQPTKTHTILPCPQVFDKTTQSPPATSQAATLTVPCSREWPCWGGGQARCSAGLSVRRHLLCIRLATFKRSRKSTTAPHRPAALMALQ